MENIFRANITINSTSEFTSGDESNKDFQTPILTFMTSN